MQPQFLIYLDRALTIVRYDHRGTELFQVNEANRDRDWQAVRAALERADWKGQPVVVGLDSQSVLVTRTKIERQTLRNPKAVTYALEDSLPLDAESMLVEFIQSGNEQLAIVGEKQEISAIVEGLSEAGILIAGICPVALLSLQELVAAGTTRKSTAVVFERPSNCDMFLLNDNKVSEWVTVQRSNLEHQIELSNLTRYDQTIWVRESINDLPQNNCVENATIVDENPLQLAGKFFGQALARNQKLPINFIRHFEEHDLRSHQQSKVSHLLMLAVLVLMISIAAALFFRGNQLQAIGDEWEDQKIALYQEIFPDQRLSRRIEHSLRNKLNEIESSTSGAVENDISGLTLVTLFNFLESLPPKMKFRFDQIVVGPKFLQLSGEVKNENEIEMLKSSFEENGFDVDQIRFGKQFVWQIVLDESVLSQHQLEQQ